MHQGPPAGGSWSGIPAGLAAGLRAEGAAVVHVNAAVPGAARLARVLGLSWAERSASRGFAAASSGLARRGIRRAAPLDGVVMIGSGQTLAAGTRYVTLDDMTVAQALRLSAPGFSSLSERALAVWRRRQTKIYDRAVACCVASEWAAASVREDYGIPAEKVHVVGFGANLEPSVDGRDWSTPRFLFAGFDWERKRGGAVVEAFGEVRRRHPEAVLDLVGGHPPVTAAGVTGHGALPLDSRAGQLRYAELLARATCLVMPSAFEPFGIAYLDAARAGAPSIGTTVGGAADAIGEGGRLVDPTDSGALLGAMLELANPEVARRLGDRARERALRFTWRAVAERILGLLV